MQEHDQQWYWLVQIIRMPLEKKAAIKSFGIQK